MMDGLTTPEREGTSVIVGIDEAGYGPLLGPLVVSAVAFEVPVSIMKGVASAAQGPDFWAILHRSVARRPGRNDARLAVADSKVLHNRADGGITLIERAALTFLSVTQDVPCSLRALGERVCPDLRRKLDGYPWYAGTEPALPVACRPDDLRTQHNALAADLRDRGISFLGAWSEVLPEGHYNRMVNATRNKAVVLFGLTVRLIQRIAETVAARPLRVWVDRQGGRIGYTRPLMNAFTDARVEVVEESPERSSYRLTRRPAPWMIRFVQKGETHHLPIALASVMSKYLRELFMMCFNAYWSARVAGLRPTAGYYQDGQRFLADIEEVLVRDKVDRQWLVRAL